MTQPRRRPEEDRTPEGDSTGGVIPYKNPKALLAYYLGIFSVIPCLGIFLGVAAFVLGIQGLKYRNEHPETKGSVHAWIGIAVGGTMALIWTGGIVLMVLAGALGPVSLSSCPD